MPFTAGSHITADLMSLAVPLVVRQGSNQDVTSSTTLVDSSLVLPVDGLTVVYGAVKFASGGGGIRWAWRTTGTAAGDMMVWTYGDNPVGGAAGADEALFRMRNALSDVNTMAHFTTSATQAIGFMGVMDGSGNLIFRFAQETSNGSATTVLAQSFILGQRATT